MCLYLLAGSDEKDEVVEEIQFPGHDLLFDGARHIAGACWGERHEAPKG